MMILLAILASLVVYLGSCVLGVWMGTRARHPWLALLLGWLATPLVGFVLALLIEVVLYPLVKSLGLLHDPYSSGRGMLLIIMPIVGLLSGLPAGIVAAVVVWRRNAIAPLKSSNAEANELQNVS
jgi:hypothetical protein